MEFVLPLKDVKYNLATNFQCTYHQTLFVNVEPGMKMFGKFFTSTLSSILFADVVEVHEYVLDFVKMYICF